MQRENTKYDMEKEDGDDSTLEANFSGIIIAVLVILLTIVIFALYRRKRGARRAVLLTGLCNTGKTSLYSQIVHKQYVKTHTSMKENVGEYVVNGKSLRIVDIPGHERVRDKFLDKYKSDARAVVYVIDSSLITTEVRDIAEYLYNILTDSTVSGNGLSLLVVCNKQDVPLSKNSKSIKSILEKELSTLQLTKSSQLESVDPKSKKAKLLSQSGEKFDFSQIPSLNVEFIDANAKSESNDEANIEELEKWLIKVA